MKNIKEISESIRSKGLDPYNLTNLLSEIKEQPKEYDKDEIIDYLASNRNFDYHSTQNDISWLMAEIGRSYKPKDVIDLCCGLGNILFHIDYCCSQGYEINENIVDIANFISPDLNVKNINSVEHNYKKKYDAIISHFPYGRTQIDGRKDDFENVFIKLSMNLLNAKGVLICLVPERLLFSTNLEKFRDAVISQNHLKSIISLPSGHFQKTGIKTSIVVIEKNVKNDKTHFIPYSNSDETLSNFNNGKNGFFIEKKLLHKRWDTNFHHPKHLELDNILNSEETKSINELSKVIIGYNRKLDKKDSGDYQLLHPKNIKDGLLTIYDNSKFIDKADLEKRTNTILQEGDIVIPRIYSDFKKLYIHNKNAKPSVAGPHLFILRSKNNEYLKTYLTTIEGRELFNQQIQKNIKSVAMPLISVSDIKNFQIPILDTRLLTKDNLEFLTEKELKEIKTKLQTSNQLNSELQKENLNLKAKVSFSNEIIVKLDLLIDKTNTIDKKIDTVLDEIISLTNDFKKIKSLPRNEESKILRMQIQLDEKLNLLVKEKTGIKSYINEVKLWFTLWDLLEPESKKFIPQAEYLLDQINELEDADYSPFIIQYSRALENEILIKLFNSYHEFLINEKIDRDNLTANEFSNSKTVSFAKAIKKDDRKYTFGTMNFIIGLLKKDGNTLSQSKLLQNFKEYVNKYFESNILEKIYMKKLNTIVSEYRNKAAHPNIINAESAMEFHELIKESIIEFIEGYREKPAGNRVDG
ncbi:N-6 DNA methylase [Mesonia sp. MT50]|uniref:site-specific DNA-methyltransferase (adenine-specific) n=1 Tax=Mesonia profundi TaxID=3070998 RepID=A0ABU1A447_9FLAO|nr:N-6 DNA methylase [Mesonia profundi]MDQ7918451.1 N-6 DNA methylase [Mesonia profundi]